MAEVLFTQPAEYDLIDIEYYITFNLENPEAAERIVNGILDEAEAVSDFPMKYPLVNDSLLQNIGLRMTHFDNYNIFYHYNKGEDVVYIIRILYNRVDWQDILRR